MKFAYREKSSEYSKILRYINITRSTFTILSEAEDGAHCTLDGGPGRAARGDRVRSQRRLDPARQILKRTAS